MFLGQITNEDINNDFATNYVAKFAMAYIGTIEDVNDPVKIGRARIRINMLYGPKDSGIPTSDLPWAMPKYPIMFGMGGRAGAASIPKVGSVVEVRFSNSNMQAPEYNTVQELADDIKEILDAEYLGTHVICSDGDEDFRIYFTKSKGVTVYNKGSRFNIGRDSAILLEHKDATASMEMRGGVITTLANSEMNTVAGTRIKNTSKEIWENGALTKLGTNPQYSAVCGEPLFALLKVMAGIIDAKLYPTPNVTMGIVEQMKQIILSKTVKVTLSGGSDASVNNAISSANTTANAAEITATAEAAAATTGGIFAAGVSAPIILPVNTGR